MARIVFDLDGTLIDSAPDLHGIANSILKDEGRDLITLDQTRQFMGNGAGIFVQRMRGARGIPDSEQDRLFSAFVHRYETSVTLTEMYPGVENALGALQKAGHPLGICTNKPIRPTHAVLEHLKLSRFFDVVIGGDSFPVHKPEPLPLLQAFDALSGGPHLYVGDSEVDAETAQRARAPFLLFTEGYRKSPVEQIPHDATFDCFSTLPDLVAGFVAQ